VNIGVMSCEFGDKEWEAIIKTGDQSLNSREDGIKVSVGSQDWPLNRTEILIRNNRSATGGASEL